MLNAAFEKVKCLREKCHHLDIEVDGGVGLANIATCVEVLHMNKFEIICIDFKKISTNEICFVKFVYSIVGATNSYNVKY